MKIQNTLFFVIISIVIQVCISETDQYLNRKFLLTEQDSNQANGQQIEETQAFIQKDQQQLSMYSVQSQQNNSQYTVQEQQNQSGAAIQQQQGQPNQQQPSQAFASPQPFPKEKDLLLVIPFTKEQFENEMKIQSEKLQKESKYYNKLNMETLKNIAIENKKIIDQKKDLIRLYLNHTTSNINDMANVLQRELEQNHETMLNLAQAIIMATLDNYEQEISNIKVKIQQLLVKIQPPTSICKKINGCNNCVYQQDCIWSPDRRACFVGSRYDGCFFDFCEFFIKDQCVSNAKVDREEQDQLDHYEEDPELAEVIKQIYQEEDVELVAQRIPQTQKNYYFTMQNKLISYKDKIQRIRIYINYMKKVYYKLRFNNILFKKKIQQQKDEDSQFQEDLQQKQGEFLKNIKETEEEKKITVDDILKNDKALENAKSKSNQQVEENKKPIQDQDLQVVDDGSIILSNSEKLQGLRVINGQLVDEKTGEVREDMKFINGRIVDEDGKPIDYKEVQSKLQDETSFIDNLLNSWFGDEYEPPNKDLGSQDQQLIEKEQDHTIIDVDSDDLENEEQTILEYVADQIERQKEEGRLEELDE